MDSPQSYDRYNIDQLIAQDELLSRNVQNHGIARELSAGSRSLTQATFPRQPRPREHGPALISAVTAYILYQVDMLEMSGSPASLRLTDCSIKMDYSTHGVPLGLLLGSLRPLWLLLRALGAAPGNSTGYSWGLIERRGRPKHLTVMYWHGSTQSRYNIATVLRRPAIGVIPCNSQSCITPR